MGGEVVARPTVSQESGGENLVEDGLGLVLVGVLGKSKLRHKDLASLGEHSLLPGRQPTLTLTAPQVAYDLRDLDHVAARQLLEVGLVAAGPVGRLLGVRRAQHLEDPVQALLADDVTDAYVF